MNFNKTTLKNGMKVIMVPMPDNPAATILVMVETGSKYEDKKVNGLSHFLEHMMFKGTPKRPKAIEISRELDSIGAHYNAFTSQEFTGYYAKAAARHIDKILDVVSDMYLNPLFDKAEIEKEKGVIVEEIRMYKDLPQRHVHNVLSTLLYGDQPMGRSITGTEENVRSFARKDFVDYMKSHYVAKATTVVVSGSFNEKDILGKIEKYFAHINDAPKPTKSLVFESQSAPEVSLYFRDTDQTHLAFAFRSFSISDPRIPAMSILSTILGKGMSSRLFSKMRDELGICYYVGADNNPFTDHGYFGISAGVDNSRIEEAVKGILEECRKLKEVKISAEELQMAKDHIAGTTMLELETSDSRAEFFGYEEVLKGKVENPQALIEKINKVTAEEVQSLAGEIFQNSGLNLALVGKFKDEVRLKEILRI